VKTLPNSLLPSPFSLSSRPPSFFYLLLPLLLLLLLCVCRSSIKKPACLLVYVCVLSLSSLLSPSSYPPPHTHSLHIPTDTHLPLSPSHKVLNSVDPKNSQILFSLPLPSKENMKLDPPIPLSSSPSLPFNFVSPVFLLLPLVKQPPNLTYSFITLSIYVKMTFSYIGI